MPVINQIAQMWYSEEEMGFIRSYYSQHPMGSSNVSQREAVSSDGRLGGAGVLTLR